MELKMLKTFICVADLGTIVAASEKLYCVQSNITNRIKTLEANLGTKLFIRSRNGMTLTAAGVLFKTYAEKVVYAEREAYAAIADFSNSIKIIRIGSIESAIAIRLPKYIEAYRNLNPDVKIHMVSGATDELVEQVLAHKLDVALIGGNFGNDRLCGKIAFREEMVLVSHASVASQKQAYGLPLITFKYGSSYRLFANNWMKKSGYPSKDIYELGTLDGILGCVAAGIGIAFLPLSVVNSSRHQDLLTIHKLKDKNRFMDTVAIYNADAAKNGAVDSFVELICQPLP